MMNNKNGTKDIFGTAVEIIMAVVVFWFMWSQSLEFFNFVFPAEKWYLAWLGLGLTGGGLIGYFIILKRGRANTPAKRFITLSMLVVCLAGELAAAGFGMQVEAFKKSGLVLSPEFIELTVTVVRGLGLFHGLALIGFFGWDDIAAAWNDKNANGIPDHLERKPRIQYAAEGERVQEHAVRQDGVTEKNGGQSPKETVNPPIPPLHQ